MTPRPTPAPRCQAVRAELVARREAPAEPLAAHLRDCAGCAGYAARLAALRRELGARQADVLPGPDFAARVLIARPTSTELLGWAALRVLPAALTLLLGLTWLGLTQTPPPTALLSDPSGSLLFTYAALAPGDSGPAAEQTSGGSPGAAPNAP